MNTTFTLEILETDEKKEVSLESIIEKAKRNINILEDLEKLKNPDKVKSLCDEELIDQFLAFSTKASEALNPDGTTANAIRWTTHEKELREFSTNFPNTLFLLSGIGEDGYSMEIWKKYFKNGKMQFSPAKISFDEYDESLLS
jgi:hypothetical protein